MYLYTWKETTAHQFEKSNTHTQHFNTEKRSPTHTTHRDAVKAVAVHPINLRNTPTIHWKKNAAIHR